MVIYSHSRLSSFEQCPLKFKFRYLDKIIPDIGKSIEAHLGSAVHAALEWVYLEVKNNNNIPTLDETIIYYSEAWQKDFTEDINIVRKNLKPKDYYNKGVEFIINYYTKHQPFNDGTMEIEKKIIINLDPEGKHKMIGFIDRLAKNIETGAYEVHDYKTANSMPTQDKLDEDRQLAMYSIAIKEIYGEDKEVTFNWHYLAHNKHVTSKRTNDQLKQLRADTIALIKKIESTTSFPPKKSVLCGWCEYSNECKLYFENKGKLTIEEVPQATPENTKQNTNTLYKDKYPTISKYLK